MSGLRILTKARNFRHGVLLLVLGLFMLYGVFIFKSSVYGLFWYQKQQDPGTFKFGQSQPSNYVNVEETCAIFKSINITYTAISEDEPCDAKFCPTMEGNMRKIASYNFAQAEPYLAQLEPNADLQSIFKGPGSTGIEIPVFVGGASSNHMGEAVRLINHLNKDIRPAYPTSRLYFFDLGLSPTEYQQLGQMCNCTMVKFPFDKFPEHVKKLFGYSWKPLIIKIMLQTYRFVMWMDTSVTLRTADLDPLFIQAKKQGVMSRCDVHLLASHTHEDTFRFLQEPPCLYRKYKEFIGRLLIFHSDNKIVNEYIILPWVKCALTEECMKTKHDTGGRLLSCQSHTVYHSCHRYDQAILSLFIYRLFPNSYMDHHIDDKYFIPI